MAAMVVPCILHPFRARVLRVRCAGAPGTADPPQRTLSDFTAYFTTFLRKKIHPPRGFSTSSKMFVEKRIENGFRWRSGHVQRKNYFIFRVCRALRSAPNAIFTGGVVTGNGICCAVFCESAAQRGTNPLRHRCAMPPPPKGEVLLYLPADAEKLPLLGELAKPTGFD